MEFLQHLLLASIEAVLPFVTLDKPLKPETSTVCLASHTYTDHHGSAAEFGVVRRVNDMSKLQKRNNSSSLDLM